MKKSILTKALHWIVFITIITFLSSLTLNTVLAAHLAADETAKDTIQSSQENPNPFGKIPVPEPLKARGNIFGLLNAVFNLLVIAGIVYAVLNIIIAGYQFISAGGDPEKVAQAWGRLWQTLVGITIIAAAFLIAGVVGLVLFGDPGIILNPKIE